MIIRKQCHKIDIGIKNVERWEWELFFNYRYPLGRVKKTNLYHLDYRLKTTYEKHCIRGKSF